MRHALGVAILFVVSSAQGATLLDTGAPFSSTGKCDAEGCGGSTDWTIIDDFTSTEDWNVTGLSFRSSGSGTVNYVSTTWTIWDADPFTNIALISGTSVATISSIVAGEDDNWFEFAIDGLDIDLAAGTYWLGHHHDFSSEDVFSALATFDDTPEPTIWLAMDGAGTNFVYDDFTISQEIRGSVVPIPAAAYLFASGLGLLGWFRRRQTA